MTGWVSVSCLGHHHLNGILAMKSQASRGLAGLNGASDASADQALIDDGRGVDRRTRAGAGAEKPWRPPSGSRRGTSRPLPSLLLYMISFFLLLRIILYRGEVCKICLQVPRKR